MVYVLGHCSQTIPILQLLYRVVADHNQSIWLWQALLTGYSHDVLDSHTQKLQNKAGSVVDIFFGHSQSQDISWCPTAMYLDFCSLVFCSTIACAQGRASWYLVFGLEGHKILLYLQPFCLVTKACKTFNVVWLSCLIGPIRCKHNSLAELICWDVTDCPVRATVRVLADQMFPICLQSS